MSSPTSDNVNFAADFKVRRSKNSSKEGVQHVRIDIGTVTGDVLTESPVTSLNPLPISLPGDVTVVQDTGSKLHTVVDSGTITTITNVVHVDDNSSSLTVDDGGSTISIDDGSGSITVDGTVAATQSSTWTVQPGNTANTTPWLVSSIETPGTPTQSSVAASASSVTLLSSNASRKKVVIYNDSTSASLYVRLNASAATSSNFTYKLYPSGYLEEYNYTGEIRGIWSAASGNARITEYA